MLRGGSPCRNTVANIFQFRAAGKKSREGQRKRGGGGGEREKEAGRGRENERNAAVFIEFAKNIFVFRVLPRTPSALFFSLRLLPPSPLCWQ